MPERRNKPCVECQERPGGKKGGLCTACYKKKYWAEIAAAGDPPDPLDLATSMRWVLDGKPCTTPFLREYEQQFKKQPVLFVEKLNELRAPALAAVAPGYDGVHDCPTCNRPAKVTSGICPCCGQDATPLSEDEADRLLDALMVPR
jgi:hypothetical protein